MKAEEFEREQPELWRAWRRALLSDIPAELPLPAFEPGAAVRHPQGLATGA